MDKKVISLALDLGIDAQDVKTLDQLVKFLEEARMKLDQIEDKGSEAFRELNAVITQAEHSLRDATDATVQLGEATEKMQQGFNAAGQSAKRMEESTVKMNQSAGLAGATLVSFSQGLTDIRYGFGAIANNISQVGTLMGALVAQTGSVKLAFQALGAAFKGPLGILVLFQGAVALIDTLSAKKKKLKKDTEEETQAISQEVLILQTLSQVVQDNTVSQENRSKALDQIKKLLPELKDLELDNAKTVERINAAIAKNIELTIIRGRTKEMLDELVKVENELFDIYEKAREGAEMGLLRPGLSDTETKRLENQLKYATEMIPITKEEQELAARSVQLREKMLKLRKEELDLIDPTGENRKKGKPYKMGDDIDADEMAMLDAEENAEIQRYADETERLYNARLEQYEIDEEFRRKTSEMVDEYATIDKETFDKQVKAERDAAEMRERIALEAAFTLIDIARALDTGLADNSKEAFERSKKYQIAETLISTYLAAQKAYNSAIAVPGVGPVYASIAAATAVAQGLARVAAIRNTTFEGGGGAAASGRGGFSIGGGDLGAPREVFTPLIDLTPEQEIKVFVTETDIRKATKTANTREARARVVK